MFLEYLDGALFLIGSIALTVLIINTALEDEDDE